MGADQGKFFKEVPTRPLSRPQAFVTILSRNSASRASFAAGQMRAFELLRSRRTIMMSATTALYPSARNDVSTYAKSISKVVMTTPRFSLAEGVAPPNPAVRSPLP